MFTAIMSTFVTLFPFLNVQQSHIQTVPDRIHRHEVIVDSQMESAKGAALAETVAQDLCTEWMVTALEAGWEAEELPRLMRIMWRESRCKPEMCGETDSPHVRRCRDWGLMQINDYSWKTTILSQGYQIEDMTDPLSNLRFARWLYEYSLERNGDGWQPWKPVKQQ